MNNIEKAKAVGHIPSGLFIVCAKDGDQKDGYLASWVQQISFDPLLVAVACNKDRKGYDAIRAGKTFTLNIVGDHDTNFMKHFWSGYSEENNPFLKLEHTVSENDGILISAAKSVIECKMISKIIPGDHEIIVAEVIASHIQHEDSKPKTHVRKSGLDY